MRIIILITFINLFMNLRLEAQNLNCADILYKKDSIEELVGVFELMPEPIEGLDGFYKRVRKTTENYNFAAKIFVAFVIDTSGNVACTKVLNPSNIILDSVAMALIKESKFISAEQRGKKVISTMVLPITFGFECPMDKKRKRKK